MKIFIYCLLTLVIIEALLAVYRTLRKISAEKQTLDCVKMVTVLNGDPKIFVLCPDHDRPSGGVKQLYRHVDILNQNGFSASVLHKQKGFRCSWFDNETRISYAKGTILSRSDYLVIDETRGPEIQVMAKGIKKVIFNQAAYYTFKGYSFNKDDLLTPYLSKDIVATMLVSEDNEGYLNYVFPKMRSYRIFNGIDPSVFNYNGAKKKQITWMLKKNRADALQVINILKFRGKLSEYDIVPIDNMSELETAKALKESMIYLNFGFQEGASLSAAEAMACGCVVIGYHGMGAIEYFKPEFCYPVPHGDIISFAKTVEEVIDLCKKDPVSIKEKAKKAADYIKEHYSLERERESVISAWKDIIKNTTA